jgi:hypothetical protein
VLKNVTAQDAAITCACRRVRIAARAVTSVYDEGPCAGRTAQHAIHRSRRSRNSVEPASDRARPGENNPDALIVMVMSTVV